MTIKSPKEMAEAFAEAIQNNDQQAAENCSTMPGWMDILSTPYQFFQQAQRKKFNFEPIEEEIHDKRAVVSITLLRGEQRRSGSFLLFRWEEGKWLIEGVSRQKEHVGFFLQGKISALFRVSSLESEEKAEEFLQNLWQMLVNREPIDRNHYSTVSWEAIRYFAQTILSSDAKLEILRSYSLPQFNRAALDFQIIKEEEVEYQSLILWREGPDFSWRILQLCSFVDLGGLLSNPYQVMFENKNVDVYQVVQEEMGEITLI